MHPWISRNMHALLGLAAVTAAVVVVGTGPLSLLADAGVDEARACARVQQYGAWGVQRLEATGFPRATTRDVEVYRLWAAREEKLALELDWASDAARCLPAGSGAPSTVDLGLTVAEYRAVVDQLLGVMATINASSLDVPSLLAVAWGVDVHVDGQPDHEHKRDLVRWVIGRARAGGA